MKSIITPHPRRSGSEPEVDSTLMSIAIFKVQPLWSIPIDKKVGGGGGGGLVCNRQYILLMAQPTAPQHLVCRVVQSLHINRMQMSIVEVFICRPLHMNTPMIPVCIRLICRLCTALHTKCCGAVTPFSHATPPSCHAPPLQTPLVNMFPS